MSELESLDLKNLHVVVLREFQTDEIQELNTDFFRNLSNFIGNLKNEEYDGIENKTKNYMITIATSLTELLINKRLEKMSTESSYSILTDEEKFVFDSNDEMNERKDMIISGGENIYSTQVEAAIHNHPGVLECAVIGIPDIEWGESVKAVVVMKPGETASEQSIIDAARKSLASYQKPKFVEFRDSLPKAPTGKILKRELRDPYWSNDKKI